MLCNAATNFGASSRTALVTGVRTQRAVVRLASATPGACAPARLLQCSLATAATLAQRPAFRGSRKAHASHRSIAVAAGNGAQQYTCALIFDCDGVIVETEELHRLAYNGAFEAFRLTINGKPVHWDVPYYDKLQNTVGGGKPKMKYHFNNNAWPSVSGAAPPSGDAARNKLVDELQDKKTEIYKTIVEQVASARPGVLELMDEALSQPEVAVAICSAATKEGFEKVVNSVVGRERLSRFNLILAGDDVSRKKPDPLIYNLASQRLGLPPQRCLVVEDSMVGLRAAKGASMPCIITPTSSTANEPFVEEGALAVVSSLAGPTWRLGVFDLFAQQPDGAIVPYPDMVRLSLARSKPVRAGA